MTDLTLLVALMLAQPPEMPILDAALSLLRQHAEGATVRAIGPVPLNGFNFYRVMRLGPQSTALVISTLCDSGILLYDGKGYDGKGRPRDFVATAEVTRLWTADLDQDGTFELLTDERVGRGTGFQLYEFRLYGAKGRMQRLWEAESYRLEAPTSLQVDRRSHIRIQRAETTARVSTTVRQWCARIPLSSDGAAQR